MSSVLRFPFQNEIKDRVHLLVMYWYKNEGLVAFLLPTKQGSSRQVDESLRIKRLFAQGGLNLAQIL